MEIPRNIAICPFCGCGLRVEIVAEVFGDDRWLATEVNVDFESAPLMEWPDQIDRELQKWETTHTPMSSAEMLAVTQTIIAWINRKGPAVSRP